jgi:hypothetical protein
VQSSTQTFVRRWRVLVAALVAAAPLLAPAVAQASTNYTWSGAAAPGTPNWSDGTNWEGSAPSGSVGTLTFPALTSPACTAKPATATCYTSTNDVAGLTVNAISINEATGYYNISGNAITLGAGGLTVTAPAGNQYAPTIHAPITLGAPQTWTINGGDPPNLDGNVTGAADALTIQTSNFGSLFVLSDVEAGAITISGEQGGVDLGLTTGKPASMNGTNGNPVNLSGTNLNAFDGSVGTLTLTGNDQVQVGQSGTPAGMLTVNGSATLDSTSNLLVFISGSGTTAGTDYSQLSATGSVNLASARLGILGVVGSPGSEKCRTLNLGAVYTLVTTTGAVVGTFAGIPDGTTISVSCPGGTLSTGPWVRINYTARTVTATVVERPPVVQPPTTTMLAVSNATPAAGEAVTYTATVTPEALMGAEPSGSVAFLDGGTPIGTCSAQPLTAGLTFSSASCTVSYAAAGAHTITATYAGDATYAGSSSTAQTVTVHASSAGGGSTGGGGTTTTTPPPAPTTGTVTVSSATITVQSSGKASIALACTGTGTCSGTLTLSAKGTKKGKTKRPKTTTIGTGKFSIPAGKSAHVALTLNAAGRALLRADHGRLNATLTILTSSPAPTRTQHVSVHLAQRSTKAKRK